MLGGIGTQEILIILFIFLLVFGAKRLPELGQAMGKGIREFKRSVSDIQDELKDEPRRLPDKRDEQTRPQGDDVQVVRGPDAASTDRSKVGSSDRSASV